MKTHSVLIVVEKPEEHDREKFEYWQKFLTESQRILKRATGIQRLAENVILISLERGLSMSTEVLHKAGDCHLKYQVLFFEQEPQWIRSADPQNAGGLF